VLLFGFFVTLLAGIIGVGFILFLVAGIISVIERLKEKLQEKEDNA